MILSYWIVFSGPSSRNGYARGQDRPPHPQLIKVKQEEEEIVQVTNLIANSIIRISIVIS
jgi:hypothetical protein